MTVDWNWVLLLTGALMILVEVLLGGFAGFDLVLIGSTFVIGGAVGMFAYRTTVGLVVASVLCILYVALGRHWVRDRMRSRKTPTNVDALVGQRGLVTQR